MDRSDVITLVSVVYNKDIYGVLRKTECEREVYCNVSSVTRSEWFDGGRAGLNPEYRFTAFAYDYHGEDTVIYNGIRYAVYRTYKGKNDTIELYVQKEAGA